MKKSILILGGFLIAFVAFGYNPIESDTKTVTELSLSVTDFADGWEDGYCEGWKDVKGQYSNCPNTPNPPNPPIGKDSYKGGYNMGFKAGMKAARK
jgi:hypothetical protein